MGGETCTTAVGFLLHSRLCGLALACLIASWLFDLRDADSISQGLRQTRNELIRNLLNLTPPTVPFATASVPARHGSRKQQLSCGTRCSGRVCCWISIIAGWSQVMSVHMCSRQRQCADSFTTRPTASQGAALTPAASAQSLRTPWLFLHFLISWK